MTRRRAAWSGTISPVNASTGTPLPATTSRAVIDLDAIAHNAHVLAAVGGVPWMAVVKADAYGHGLAPVAITCLRAGATWLGVAQLAEALHLRALLDAAGVARPAHHPDSVPTSERPRLLCWLMPVLTPEQAAAPGSVLRAALAAGIDLSVSTRAQLDAIAAAARAESAAAGVPARIHLKVDTGMSRGGAAAADLPALAAAAKAAEDEGTVAVVALWSHLSRAEELGSGSTAKHLSRFLEAERTVAEAGLNPRLRHLAATAGLLWHPDARLDLVRIGIGLYGLSPDPAVANSAALDLVPAMRLEAPLTQVKRIPAGQAVSYGGTWRAPTDRWLGLVPLGYGDGVPRAASNGGPVAVGGIRSAIVGRVCMDQVVIDLGPATTPEGAPLDPPAAAGDVAVLWGAPDAVIPAADEWAQVCSTINYEIVTRLGERVPRVYLGRDAARISSLHDQEPRA
ncbi:alanine racemase [Actinomyces qiguomingii]|uniref:alanine racemase n=1 Tax=Actinomyces qiguomingii TaxID=2057800 RepID=UPI000CA06CEF|nr:alanine racemase [Actinomyces qiguomingii]